MDALGGQDCGELELDPPSSKEDGMTGHTGERRFSRGRQYDEDLEEETSIPPCANNVDSVGDQMSKLINQDEARVAQQCLVLSRVGSEVGNQRERRKPFWAARRRGVPTKDKTRLSDLQHGRCSIDTTIMEKTRIIHHRK